MSSNLKNSAALAKAGWFGDVIRAAMVEKALVDPRDPLARSIVRDPTYLLPVFTSINADNPAISADAWQRWETEPMPHLRHRIADVNQSLTESRPSTGRSAGTLNAPPDQADAAAR